MNMHTPEPRRLPEWDGSKKRDWLFGDPRPKIIEAALYVSRITGVSVEDIRGPKQSRKVARARHAAMFLAYRDLDVSTTQIGRVFNRDHTSVVYAIDSVKRDPDLYPIGEQEPDILSRANIERVARAMNPSAMSEHYDTMDAEAIADGHTRLRKGTQTQRRNRAMKYAERAIREVMAIMAEGQK